MANAGIMALMVICILLNLLAAAAGLALMALGIWVAVDPYKMYPISALSGKDDIFAAAWIAIFTGFAYFCTAIFGIYAILKKKRNLILVYLILMFIIFLFESASCITAVTNRDFLIGNNNMVKHEMLKYYGDTTDKGKMFTATWNNIMQKAQCCGTDSPVDWVEYNSLFRTTYGRSYTWPVKCCKYQGTYDTVDLPGCMQGQTSAIFTQGCFSYIESVLSRYTWVLSWYGFAVQMLLFFVLLIVMVYYFLLK